MARIITSPFIDSVTPKPGRLHVDERALKAPELLIPRKAPIGAVTIRPEYRAGLLHNFDFRHTIRHGTAAGNAAIRSGKLALDGSGDYVDYGHDTSTHGLSAMTILARFSTNNPTSNLWWAVVQKRETGGEGPFALTRDAGDNNKLRLYVRNSSNGGGSAKSDSAMSAGKDYIVCCTWDGTTVRMWINGVYQSTTGSVSGVTDTGATQLRVGVGKQSASEYLNGTVEFVRVWNIAFPNIVAKMLSHDPYLVTEPI
jgi:hypothetical protein